MSPDERSHREVVRSQFAAQSARFDKSLHYLDAQDMVTWISRNLQLRSHFSVLDVATGTGLLARAIAPNVRQVIGLDTTPEMLQIGKEQAQNEALTNILFEDGVAEQLPYPNQSFDLVASRLAVHHFQHPLGPFQEMSRVCRLGGHVATIDITSSPDAEVAVIHNRLERLRDPSHTRAMHIDELRQLNEISGLEITHTSQADVVLDVERWMDLTNTKPQARAAIRQAMEAELAGGPPTGMRPLRKAEELMFVHAWAILVGRKVSSPRVSTPRPR